MDGSPVFDSGQPHAPSIYWQDHVGGNGESCTSSLDTLETSLQAVVEDLNASKPQPPPSIAFRHSCWAARREIARRAMALADVPEARLRRFDACGSKAFVEVSYSPSLAYRVRASKCRDRLCVPCARERRIRLALRLAEIVGNRRLRFLSLTLRSSALPLSDQLNRLWHAWNLFRRRRPVAKAILGGITFLELTYREDTGQWHPHLHVLYEGHYLSQKLASQLWHAVTGDSFVVDIRALRNVREATSYVTKYASKMIPPNVAANERLLAQVVGIVASRRTFAAFGTWRQLDLNATPSDDRVWQYLAPLDEIVWAARAGDRHARSVLMHLCLYSTVVNSAGTSDTGPPLDIDDTVDSSP